MIVNNYVLRITAVIIVYGDSIEVPTCGRAKISGRGRGGLVSGAMVMTDASLIAMRREIRVYSLYLSVLK